MASDDWFGPQFDQLADFNPSGKIYGGVDSEFRFSRESPDLQVTRNSRGMANMLGRHRAADIDLRIPTGATTDYQTRGDDFSNRFLPARPPAGSGRWN